MSVSKERREELRRQFKNVGGLIGQVCPQGGPTVDELRALLDMADERDRYRVLLVEARAAIDVVGWALQSDIDKTRERIDAALEGKNNG